MIKIKRIWVVFFIVKVFYLFFAIFIFSRLTTLGDTFDYLNSPLEFSTRVFYNSTAFMQFTGALFKLVFRIDVIACIPFMLLSFYGIYYAVDRLNLYRYSTYLIILFSLPNFGVWTSILGKEAVGCFFMSVIAVIIIKKLQGPHRIRYIEYLALGLCAIFKPQYLLFIVQAILYLSIVQKFKDKKNFPLLFGLLIIVANSIAIYLYRDLIDELARGMAIHFKSSNPNLAQSTRSEQAWMEPYGFFYEAPYGMLIAFFGPTFPEMLSKPAHLISGIESIIMLFCFLFLLAPRLKYILANFRFNPKVFIVFFIVFVGILFVQYPFGYLNPGSAIRYRANFYALFVLLLLYLFTKKRNNAKIPSQF